MANFASFLKIEVVSARKLSPPDDSSKLSPYVLIKYNNKTKSTDVIQQNNNPKWRVGSLSAEFKFLISPVEHVATLVILDWQGETGLDRVIGTIELNVKALVDQGGNEIADWFDIEPPAFSFGNVIMKLATEKKEQAATGQLQLRVSIEKKKVAVEKSPLWAAVKTKAVDQVKASLKAINFKDLNATNTSGETVLHIAVVRKDWDFAAAQILLMLLDDERLDVNVANQDENTPFHYFCQRYTGPQPFGPFDRFIERGADVHAKNKFGETVLHKAVFHPSLKLTLIDMLISRGADVNAAAIKGDTPLHYAVRLGREDVVRFLLQKGADPTLESQDGHTPLDVANAENPDIAERIRDTLEVLKWLKRNDLMSLQEEFIANDIFVFIISDLTDEYLDRLLPDEADRAKVLRAVHRFKRELGSFKSTSAEREKKEQFAKQVQELKQADRLRKSLDAAAHKRLSSQPDSPPAHTSPASPSTAAATPSSPPNSPKGHLDDGEGGKVPNASETIRDSHTLITAKRKENTTGRRVKVSKEKKKREVEKKSSSATDSLTSTPSRKALRHSKVHSNASSDSDISLDSDASTSSVKGPPSHYRDTHHKTSPSSSTAVIAIPPIDDSSWEADIRELDFIRSLGMGSSGEVFLAKYHGEDVAVKVLHQKNTDNEIDEFKKEFQVLIALKSDYVVKFYGATVQNRLSLIMEFCARGSLFDVLRDSNTHLTWVEFFRMAKDIALGLATLHEHKPEVLHRDMKTLNLLVTDGFRVKLCDFGLSRFNTGSNLATLSKQRGTYAYIPPEIYDCEVFTTKSDVYSVGIIFWEILFRLLNGFYQRPYKEYPFIHLDFQTLVMARKKNLRPTLPDEIPQPIKDLVFTMWDASPDKRPEARAVVIAVEAIEKDYLANTKKWNNLLAKAISKQLEKAAAAAAVAVAAAASDAGNTNEVFLERDALVRVRHESSTGLSSKPIIKPVVTERRGSSPQPVAFKEEKEKLRSEMKPIKAKSTKLGPDRSVDNEDKKDSPAGSRKDKKKRERASSMMEDPGKEKEKKKDRSKLATVSGGGGDDSPASNASPSRIQMLSPGDMIDKDKRKPSKERIKYGGPAAPLSGIEATVDLSASGLNTLTLGSILHDT